MAASAHRFALVTPARNEEDHIGRLIEAVAAQTTPPVRYVVVSDGSTDRTDEIIAGYAEQHPFITFVRSGTTPGVSRNFGSKVRAFNAGYDRLKDIDYDFIGNLDADMSFEPDYFEKLLQRFDEDKDLGVAGGDIYELIGGRPMKRLVSRQSVSGAVQMFRRECFEDIGGYQQLDRGGIDAAAEIMARMKGWDVRLQTDLKAIAHRPVQTGRKGPLATRFNKGVMNRQLGYHPLFHLAVSARQMMARPYILGGLYILAGYVSAMLKGAPRVLPDEVVAYLRAEQMHRLGLGARPAVQRSAARSLA